MRALKHIEKTRSAARTIHRSIKFFIEKKKLYELRLKEDPSLEKKSEFVKLILFNEFVREDNQIVFTLPKEQMPRQTIRKSCKLVPKLDIQKN